MSYRYEASELRTILNVLDALNNATGTDFGAYDGKIDIYFVDELVGSIKYVEPYKAWVYVEGKE